MRRLAILFSFPFILISCDSGYGVFLHNNSSADKEVKVVAREQRRVAATDSILIADTLSAEFGTAKVARKAITQKDLAHNSYSLVLEKGKTAILSQGIGKPHDDLHDLFEMIILNNNDSILLSKDKRLKVNKRFMSASFTITVK